MSGSAVILRAFGLVTAGLLAGFGGWHFAEGWRLQELRSFSHAGWWDRSGVLSSAAMEVSRPATADGRAWSSYSHALLAWADKRPAGGTPDALSAAESAVRRAVTLAPVQPSAWARLALLRLNAEDSESAVEALAWSYRTGPAVSRLAWLRSRIGLFLWTSLDCAEKAAVAADIRRVWGKRASARLPFPQATLVRFAHGIQRLDAVRIALPRGEHPLLAKRIEAAIKEAAGAS